MPILSDLVVRITGETRDFQRSIDKAEKQTKGFQDSIGKLQKGLLAVGGAAGLAFAAKRFLEVGVAAEETASKFRTVFGPAVGEVNTFLNEFAINAGLSITRGRELTATVGAIAQGIGFTERAAAGLSEQTVRLAADIASFNNTQGGTERVVRSLISAMNGETESLKEAANVAILQSDVMERAAEMTGKATSEITRQERALATLELVTERAGKAVGDLDRTQDSAANTIRRLRARALSVVEAFSSALLPALATVLADVDESTEGFDNLTQSVFQNSVVIGRWAKLTVSGVRIVIQAHVTLIRVVTNLAEQFVNLFELMGRGLAGQIDGVRAAWRKMQKDTEDVGDALFDFVDAMGEFTLAAQEALDAPIPKLDLVREGVDGVTDSVNTAAGAVRELKTQLEALPDQLGFGRSIEASRRRQMDALGGIAANLDQDRLLKGLGGRLGQLAPDEIIIMDVGALTFDEPPEIDFGAGKGAENLFDDLKGFLGDNLNPTEILSNTAANLLSGGIGSLIGTFTGAIAGFFGGESPAEAEARRIREKNTEAIERLNQGIARLGDQLFGERGGDIGGLRKMLGGIRFPGGGIGGIIQVQNEFEQGLAKLGLTFEEAQRIAKIFGVTLDGSVNSILAFREAIRSDFLDQIQNDWSTWFGLMQKRFELLDITDFQTQMDSIMKFLSDKIGKDLFRDLQEAIASGNLDEFIDDFLSRVFAGDESIFALLGDLSLDEFLEMITFLEKGFDDLSDSVNKATDAFRNVPRIFKTQLRIFQASDPDAFRDPVTGQLSGGGSVNIDTININGSQDPRRMVDQLEREIERRKRQGGARLFQSNFTRAGVE